MKTTKSPSSTEVTPSKKKLTQARLPFKLLSDVPSPVTSKPRKRKLSPTEPEVVSKIGKLSKENENETLDESITISDDDCKEINNPIENGKPFNPLAKMVDQALSKKKQKKSKAKSNRKKSKEKVKKNELSCNGHTEEPVENDELMDIGNNMSSSTINIEKLTPSKKTDSDKSISSNPTTPQHNKSLSVNSQRNDSLLDSSKLTPKQLQKKVEATKKKEEREKERLEREQKKLQEKEEKAKQRQEKEEQRRKEREAKEEEKRKEREEKEEQRRKEKEDKEKQKELEKKQREEKEEQKRKEREEKEEQKRKEKEAKEEEKKKKQEALELEKQEQELKKKKAAEAFVNFFVPKRKDDKDTVIILPSKSSVLSSFTVKSDMRLAPTVRVDLSKEKKEALVKFIEVQTSNMSELYLKSLKNGYVPKSCGKTWPLEDDDVIIVEDELPQLEDTGEIITCEPAPREKLRPKLLSFHENRRPPYWGTWRKKSAYVKPRKPFGQDEKHFNYEVDSDDEWEEEQEGESIDGSVCGSEEDNAPDEYEVDNEVFVPHGYLSDEEGTMDDDDMKTLSPEAQKEKLKFLEDEFELELKKPTEKLKPRLFGLIWETQDGGKPDNCVDAVWNYFGKITMIMNDPTELMKPPPETEKDQEKKKVKKKKVPIEGEQNETASPKTPKTPKNEKKKKSKEDKELKKADSKKNTPEVKKQPGINMFLNKMKT